MFKQGDKVKAKFNTVRTGTVLLGQENDRAKVRVKWDISGNEYWEYPEDLVKVPAAVEAKETGFLYKKGDRVKMKYNKNAGTVTSDQRVPFEGVLVKWDHRNGSLTEEPSDLLALHTPRERDEPHPMQAAIDNIEEERVRLKKQIEDLQFKLGGLTKAKKMLEEGW